MKPRRRTRQWFVDAAAILIGLAAVAPLVWVHAEDERLSADGRVTTGVVQSKEAIDGGGETLTSYSLRYSFEDVSGREHTRSAGVEYSIYERISVGDPLPIQYLADQPETSRIVGVFNPGILEVVAVTALGLIYFFFLGPQRWIRELRGKPDPVLT
ncbi:MAG: hypothetical protein M3P43_07180 [Actinomycetota bacterium]|nr:hypothetical protein [Actinomycetota bacterium]